MIPNRVESGHGHGDLGFVQGRVELDRLRQHLTQEIRGAQDRPQLVEHRRFEFCGRQSRQTRGTGVFLGVALGHVVPVAPAILLGGVPRGQCTAVVAEHDALEQIGNLGPRRVAPHPAIRLQDRVDAVPQFATDDRRVFGLVPLILVPQLAKVSPVAQELVDVALVDRPAIARLAVLCGPGLRRHAIQFQLLDQCGAGPEFDEALEDVPDQLGLAFVGHQSAVLDVVAQRRHAPHPHAFALAGRDLVADALASDLALELREGEQDVQHQPTHGGRRVELLGDRHERHAIAFEHFDHLGEVRQAARQSVDLVDDDHIDLAGFDVRHHPLERRTFHVATGEGRIVVIVGYRYPAFGALAGDVGMTGIALSVDRVVFLVQSFIGGFARVDRTAHAALQDFAHRPPLFLVVGLLLALDGGLSPKNSGPDQRMPVISRAIIERLGYMRPWKSYWPSAVAITRYSTPLYSRTSTVPAAGR